MNDIRKKRLTEYLYPTTEIAEFMFYDFYVELMFVLDKKICFSVENKKENTRKSNFEKAKFIIGEFIEKNLKYKNKLEELYRCEIGNSFIEEVLWGYIIFVITNINRGTGADVFGDKRSVCYNCISILDIN